MTRATVESLTRVIRMYQTANTREDMALADAEAMKLIGFAAEDSSPKRRAKRS